MDGGYAACAVTSWTNQGTFAVPSLSQGHRLESSNQQHHDFVPDARSSITYNLARYTVPHTASALPTAPVHGGDIRAIYSMALHSAVEAAAMPSDGGRYDYPDTYNSGYGVDRRTVNVYGVTADNVTSGAITAMSGYNCTSLGGSAASVPRNLSCNPPPRFQQHQPHQPPPLGGGPASTWAVPSSVRGAVVGRVKEGALVSRQSVENLARSAPLWVVYYSYSVNGPTGQPGVLTPDLLVQAYSNRRVHGHTLLVGLTAEVQPLRSQVPGMTSVITTTAAGSIRSSSSAVTHPSSEGSGGGALVPPAFLRPLVFHLAMAKAGVSYKPISAEQLSSGLPPPNWSLPGSLLQPKSVAICNTPITTAGGGGGTHRQPLACWDAATIDDAVQRLLMRAPYWCLLNAYGESGRWNCLQNMTAAQVRQRLQPGAACLHACVLGTLEQLQGGLWIPTSMVLPLGVLLQTMVATGNDSACGDGGVEGLEYFPPSAADVQYFIEDAVRAVQGRPEAAAHLTAYVQRLELMMRDMASDERQAAVKLRGRLNPRVAAFVPLSRVSETKQVRPPSTCSEMATGSGSQQLLLFGECESHCSASPALSTGSWAPEVVAEGEPAKEAQTPACFSSDQAQEGASAAEAAGAASAECAGLASSAAASVLSDTITDRQTKAELAVEAAAAADLAAGDDTMQQDQHTALVPMPMPVGVGGSSVAGLFPSPISVTRPQPTPQEKPPLPLQLLPPPLPAPHQQQKQRSTAEPYLQQQKHQPSHNLIQEVTYGSHESCPVLPVRQPVEPGHQNLQFAVQDTSQQQHLYDSQQQQQHSYCPHPLPDTQPQGHMESYTCEMLSPILTPFLRFETALFRLFQGDQGESAFTSLWWIIEPQVGGNIGGGVASTAAGSPGTAPHLLGPYSCEQMILAYIAKLLSHEASVCGTQSSLETPAAPPVGAFRPLGSLLTLVEDGQSYKLLPAHSLEPIPLKVPVGAVQPMITLTSYGNDDVTVVTCGSSDDNSGGACTVRTPEPSGASPGLADSDVTAAAVAQGFSSFVENGRPLDECKITYAGCFPWRLIQGTQQYPASELVNGRAAMLGGLVGEVEG